MPANTVNRGYPYSIPGDPADVAGALQALADAVDSDVTALQGLGRPRAVARVRGITPVTTTANPAFPMLPFELVDFNVGGAIEPLTDGTVRVLLPGLWFAVATVVYVSAAGSSTINYVGASIVHQDTNDEVGIFSTHTTSFTGLVRTADIGGAQFMGDPSLNDNKLFIRGEVRRTSGTVPHTFRDRTLTVMRMTES